MTDKEKEQLEEMLRNGSTIRLKDIAYADGHPHVDDNEPDEKCCGDCCWFYLSSQQWISQSVQRAD